MALAAASLASCNGNSVSTPEAIPVQLDDEDSWSLVDFGGEVIAKNAFDNPPSYAYNGRFVAEDEDGGMYVYSLSNPKKALNKEPYMQLTNFAAGNAFGVRQGTAILLVGTDGEVIKQLSEDIANVYIPTVIGDTDIPLYTDADGKTGYINASGDIAIKAKWDIAAPFSEGLALVCNYDEKFVCINTKGEKVFTLKEKEDMWIRMFLNGWLGVNKEGRGHFVDRKGETVMKLSRGTEAVARFGDRVLAKNSDGFMLLEAKEDGEKILKGYKYILPIGTDGTRFLVRKRSDGKYRVVDANGEDVGDDTFESLEDETLLWYGYFLGGDEKPYTIYDKNGERINKKLDIDDIRSDRYTGVLSQKIYNKKQVAALVGIIGNGESFGGSEGVPSIGKGATASSVLPAISVSAESAYSSPYYHTGAYRVTTSINDEVGTLTLAFANAPADWTYEDAGWSYTQRYYYTNAAVSLLVLATPVSDNSRTATATALIDALMAKGWERAGGHSHELRNNAGNYVYIVPASSMLRIVYSFGQLDYKAVMGSALDSKSGETDQAIAVDTDEVAVPVEEVEAVAEY